MKNFCKLFGIIAIFTIIGFSTTACDNGSGGDGGGINISQLPEFPSGSAPAVTRSDAETILAELRISPVHDSIYGETMEVIEQNRPNSVNYNYSFSNRSLPNGFVRVSASETRNETNTGGFQLLSANEEERNNIQFARGNRVTITSNSNLKAELTRFKTEGGVTVAKGSTFEIKYSESYNATVTTAGPYTTFRINSTYSAKQQQMEAFTVTTSSGSVKVILDINIEISMTGNNVNYYWDYYDRHDETENTGKYSGSLKVYGSNNTLLIDHRIVDEESYDIAQYMIYNDLDDDYLDYDATLLTNNVKVNGNISTPGSVALYSINVTNGTTYHLWLDGSDTNGEYMDVEVRGYYSGYLFFDMDCDWDLDWGNYYSFTATLTGMVYIMVYPLYGGDTGTFAIVYNTTGNQPAMSVSFIAPFSANSRSVQNKTSSVVIPKKATGILRYNKR